MGEEAIITPALAISGVALMWLGRFDEAERRLDRADRAAAARGGPDDHAHRPLGDGLLRLIQGRLEEALAGLAEAQRLSSPDGQGGAHDRAARCDASTQVRMGRAAEASAALAELDEDERDRALIRIAAAEIHLAQDDPEAALEVLAPVIEGSRRAAHSTTSLMDALLFVALARARLGDARATEEAIERALELAEREGIIVPFAVAPVGELLERHPRHRTAQPRCSRRSSTCSAVHRVSRPAARGPLLRI